MTQPDHSPTTPPPTTTGAPTPGKDGAIQRLARVISQAARFPGDAYGLGNGERAALARMNPEAMRAHQIAALSRALIQAELNPEHWKPDTWRRWALIAHGMALAGHNGKGTLGEQLHSADVAENRVTKLLTARGAAFRRTIPPLLRLLASREVALNWSELGDLILCESRPDKAAQDNAEKIRMKIAGRYYSAQARSTSKTEKH